MEANEIIKSALSLPHNVRASLAELLLESLDYEEDFPVSKEWQKEINRRCQEIDAGQVALIDGEEGLSQLRKKYL